MSDEPAQPSAPVGAEIGRASAASASRTVVALLCAFVLIMLVAGLRPHSSYSNRWVTFDSTGRSSVFGHYGLMTGELDAPLGAALARSSFEIAMRVQLHPPPDNRFQVLLQIDSPGSADPLIVGQWKSVLIVMSGRDYRDEHARPRLSADLSEHLGTFVDVLVALAPGRTRLVVERRLAADGPPIPFDRPPARISLGNAPDGGRGWSGRLKGLTLRSTLPGGASARYELDRDALPTIVDSETGRHTLNVPEPGRFPDSPGIGRMRWTDLLEGNLGDVLVNLAGFGPFGFLACAALLLRNARRAVARGAITARVAGGTAGLASVAGVTLAGLLASLGIETLQIHIPGRSPHVHDLLLNTVGAAAGALCAYVPCRALRLRVVGAPPEPPPATRRA